MYMPVSNICVSFEIGKCFTATKETVRNDNNEKIFIHTANKNIFLKQYT